MRTRPLLFVPTFSRSRCGLVWLLASALVACSSSTASERAGDAAAVDRQIEAQLSAGNFQRAAELAAESLEPATRDDWLGRIARQQVQAGDRSGAVRSAALIEGDVARTATLRDFPPAAPVAPRGGGANADFDSLIDLITSTVHPQGWDEVGGPGTIREYPGGVFVDPQGVLRRLQLDAAGLELEALRRRAAQRGEADDVRQASRLRKVSLNRLEKYAQLRSAAGQPLEEAMLLLAGIYKVQYLLVYPETGDLVLAGPAGPWGWDAEGRVLNLDTGRPVLRLDDLATLLRQQGPGGGEPFGCAITPTQQALARTQAYLNETGSKPLPQGTRDRWLSAIRDQVGQQVIDVFGIDATSRAARVLVEADYRMKLIGIGLEQGTPEVPSYLAMVADRGGRVEPFGVLRWWFTMNYDSLAASPERDAFQLRGQSVRVQSENERLTEQGERVQIGQADQLNARFARNFTEHYDALAVRYPIYAELENLFDLALVAGLIRTEGLHEQVGWHLTWLGDDAGLQLPQGRVPTRVETVLNHQMLAGKRFVAAVSGGVIAEPAAYLAADAIEVDRSGRLQSERVGAMRQNGLPADVWWWD